MRIQYWASKGNARIDSCLIKVIKGLMICSLKTMRDLNIWKKVGRKGTAAQFENTMADRCSSIENSMEKTDENFADEHTKIESVFEECEKAIELLFVEVENKIEG
jgi:hypothetical protein